MIRVLTQPLNHENVPRPENHENPNLSKKHENRDFWPKFSPAAGKIVKNSRLRQAKLSKILACVGQNGQKNSPAAGKIVKNSRTKNVEQSTFFVRKV